MPGLGREIVSSLLLGPGNDGRLVHESPVRGDVWASFASEPKRPVDILIEVYRDFPTGPVADRLARRLHNSTAPNLAESLADYDISYLEGLVTARLTLRQLAAQVLPYTAWAEGMRSKVNAEDFSALENLIRWQLEALRSLPEKPYEAPSARPLVARMASTLRILATLLWAEKKPSGEAQDPRDFFRSVDPNAIANEAGELARAIVRPRETTPSFPDRESADIFSVSRNRPIELAISRSIPAIKADAVSTLFSISCERIAWAVLDTGIDATHPAFAAPAGKAQKRIIAAYDFTRLRRIVSVDHLYNRRLLDQHVLEFRPKTRSARLTIRNDLLRLAEDAQNGRSIDWGIAEKYVKIEPTNPPKDPHGTHVAGILGASWVEGYGPDEAPVAIRGVCPDIRLYDFRVVTGDEDDTEFGLVGALQFIRHLNRRNNFPVIHGANISLSIRHDVRNYACGQTPVCNEAQRVVESGVVVVVAAGNRGYQSYHLTDGGAFETYAPSSITDPGNADAVITVGATHRSAPHTYGVSFFSSRGPTGDGRQKPDLVAPGEKIWSVIPGGTEDAYSGTSMAAPHVSGAAAMLMARNAEFIGRAADIKTILCATCTDLGRERSFQGAGMLDILRAMQRV